MFSSIEITNGFRGERLSIIGNAWLFNASEPPDERWPGEFGKGAQIPF
jgi:hypothetical protein